MVKNAKGTIMCAQRMSLSSLAQCFHTVFRLFVSDVFHALYDTIFSRIKNLTVTLKSYISLVSFCFDLPPLFIFIKENIFVCLQAKFCIFSMNRLEISRLYHSIVTYNKHFAELIILKGLFKKYQAQPCSKLWKMHLNS